MKNKNHVKMPGKMKKNLEEYKEIPASDFGNKLFESMMVFGPEKKDLS
jgi:hypothetical protein